MPIRDGAFSCWHSGGLNNLNKNTQQLGSDSNYTRRKDEKLAVKRKKDVA